MRILYGVVGEGMGHAMRSRVILDHLIKEHEVQVVASSRAHDYLKARFSDVHRIWGLSIAFDQNAMDLVRTATQNLRGALTGWPMDVARYFEIARSFKPDLVISDFESWSYLFAKNQRLPVISLDNMQIINRCAHAPEILAGDEAAFQMAKGFVKAKLPGCYHYLITSFFFPLVRKKRTTLVPPVLRPEILAATPKKGEHLVVYQTSTSNVDLPKVLAACGMECRVYGLRRDLKEEVVEGNLRYRPFSETGFVDDLRTARAVIANGGFTLMSESVYLRKPMLSIPVGGQFEQTLNAKYLERSGYGAFGRECTAEPLKAFLEKLPRYEESLAPYRQDGNAFALAALESQMARAMAGEDPGEISAA